MEYEDYIKERTALDEIRLAQINTFDKSTLTISASSIAFSITLLTFLGARQGIELQIPEVIVVSWICFSLAIILNLSSYLSSARSCLQEIKELDRAFGQKELVPWKPNLFHTVTVYFNRIALAAMMVGMAALFLFAYTNVTEG